MPGMIGGIGLLSARSASLQGQFESLQREFRETWGDYELINLPTAFLAGHSFVPGTAVHTTRDGVQFAVDGESAIYVHAHRFAEEGRPELYCLEKEELGLRPHAKGNVAILAEQGQVLYLITEHSASFPLYYAEVEGGLLFSSLMRPLGRAVGAEPDPAGVVQYCWVGYHVNGRTHFKGVRGLLPGQALIYEAATGRMQIRETSRAWLKDLSHMRPAEIVEQACETLSRAVDRTCMPELRHALMMSGGWDSRLALAALRKKLSPSHVQGYLHGDPASRELALGLQICRRLKVPCHLQPVEEDSFQLAAMPRDFARSESLEWFYWHRAACLLASRGINCIGTGMWGEVMGGGFGTATLLKGSSSLRHLACLGGHLLNVGRVSPRLLIDHGWGIKQVHGHLRLSFKNRPWTANVTCFTDLPGITEEINADVMAHLKRIEARGIDDPSRMIEAFITETKGGQRMTAQLRCLRAYVDVANLFADQEFFYLGSWVPYRYKIHCLLFREILRRVEPALLRYSTAATLVPAGSPILLQEASRVMRRVFDDAATRLVARSRVNLGIRPSGYMNLEFLRDGRLFTALIDSLRTQFLDKSVLRDVADQVVHRQIADVPNNVSKGFLRVYAADLFLR